jgi:hypothetical protein
MGDVLVDSHSQPTSPLCLFYTMPPPRREVERIPLLERDDEWLDRGEEQLGLDPGDRIRGGRVGDGLEGGGGGRSAKGRGGMEVFWVVSQGYRVATRLSACIVMRG